MHVCVTWIKGRLTEPTLLQTFRYSDFDLQGLNMRYLIRATLVIKGVLKGWNTEIALFSRRNSKKNL